jgi:hypothetical protein
VIMRHTDQPFIHSHKIVQSVLTLITMVTNLIRMYTCRYRVHVP